jgi:hypothetical protein
MTTIWQTYFYYFVIWSCLLAAPFFIYGKAAQCYRSSFLQHRNYDSFLPDSGTILSDIPVIQHYFLGCINIMKNYLLTITMLLVTVLAFGQKRYAPAISREELLNQEFCTGLFATREGVYFDMENDASAIGAEAYFNVLDWLQGRVAGLQIYTYRNTRIPVIRNTAAAVYLNEMPVSADFLNALSVTDIAMIKVIKLPFGMFWGASGGAIAIYTKKGAEDEGED